MENPLDDIESIDLIEDDAEAIKEIGRRLGAIPSYQETLRAKRQERVLRMKARGLSYGKIGDEIGLHRNRVQQIAEGSTAGGKGGIGDLPAAIRTVSEGTPRRPEGRTRYVIHVAASTEDILATLHPAGLDKSLTFAGLSPVEVSTLSRTAALRVHDVLNAAGIHVVEPKEA